MKKVTRIILAAILVVFTVSVLAIAAFAAAAPQNGWYTDENGVERYYQNGTYLTGKQKIGDYTYMFAEDGAYIKMYDNPTAVGIAYVMDTDEYKNAISALGSRVYQAMPIEPTVNKVSYNGKNGTYVDIVSGAGNSVGENLERSNYIKNATDPSAQPIFVHLKNSEFKFITKPNGKTAIQTWQSRVEWDPYIQIYAKSFEAGADFVFDIEYKLGENFQMAKDSVSLMEIMDRTYPDYIDNNGDGVKDIFVQSLLELNKDGMVYASRFSESKYICQLSEYDFTRISVAVHPSENTYDVYVNGVLVVSGIKYLGGDMINKGYDPQKIVADEFRILQYGEDYLGTSVCVDNIYVYGTDKPVCTTAPEPRNGIYVDENSVYLRNYVNNLLVSGKAELSGTYFGRTFNNEVVVFDARGRYFTGNTASLKVDGQVKKSEIVNEDVFVAPKSSEVAEGKKFVGWKVTDADGNSRLLRTGDKFRVDSDITYEPVAFVYDMLDGASVKTNKDSTGLRYIARISKSEYDMLISLGFKIEAHILTMPTEYIEKAYGYTTLDALQDLDQSVYNEWKDSKSEGWYHQTDNFYYYTASVSDIAPESFMRDYSATGYLKLTYPDGRDEYIYTDYSEENNARNVYEVASKAYNDRTLQKVKNQNYTVKVEFKGKKTYSPYDTVRLNAVKSFVDKIINLTADDTGVTTVGEYYEPSYKLDIEDAFGEYNITVKNNGEWLLENAVAFILNGKLVSSELSGGEYSHTVEYEATHISTDNSPEGGVAVDTWYFIDTQVRSDRDYFPVGNTSFPTVAPNGETSGFVWDFMVSSSKKNLTFFEGSVNAKLGWNIDGEGNSADSRYTAKKGTKTNKYVLDMSDWQNMEFWVYVEEEYVGSKFIMLFYSENPDSAGDDYYIQNVTLSKAGWNRVYITKENVSSIRVPLGWDHITGIKFISNDWGLDSANGDYGQELYMTSIVLDDNEAALASEKRLNGAAAFYVGGYASVINGRLYVTDPDNHKVTAFKDGDTYYFPALSLAKALGYSAKWYKVGSVIAMELEDGYEYRLASGKEYSKNGDIFEYKKEAKIRDGNLFISAEDAMAIFGYSEMYVDPMGAVVLSNTKDIFNSDADYDIIYSIIEECTYVRPTGEKVYDDLMDYSGGVHPYLMLNQADFDRLNYYKKKEPTLAAYIKNIANTYDVGRSTYLADPVVYNISDGSRLLPVSREAKDRTRNFALLYKLYEFDNPEKATLLAERLWEELEAICNFPDWHPQHYLDTAEMAYGVAIGYDWLYDYWKKYDAENGTDRLGIMERALYEYSLKTTTALPDGSGYYDLGAETNNWNGVCNGGTMVAALALVTNPTYREDAITVIGASIIGVESGMWAYGPDGGYEEGSSYWAYATTYLSVLMSSLDSACGTDYGLYNIPGFAHSIYFTTYIGTMDTTWGFHDVASISADTSIAGWFAMKSGDGNINAIRRQAIDNGWKSSNWYDVVWFSPHIVNETITLALDSYYSLDTVITFRDSWDEKNSVFVGLHGGDNQASHGDLDIGNFVIYVDGVQMISELGMDEYNIAGYFGIYRWSYYRKRAEGQNTLVMIPHGESWDGKTGIPKADPVTNKDGTGDEPIPDQNSSAVSKCLRYEASSNSALAVVDMAPAYKDYVADGKGAIRGLWFKDDRSTIIIQDEGTYSRPMDIWWFAHTEGVITVSEDGKSAIIERGGICLYAELVTNIANAKFYTSEAVSLDPSYVGDPDRSEINPSTGKYYHTGDYEKSRDGITKLCIKAENVTEYKVAVVFKVIDGSYDIPQIGTTYTWTDIKDWKVD